MVKDVFHQFLQRYAELKLDQDQRPGKDIFTTEFQKIKRESEQLVLEKQVVSTYGAKEFNRKKNRYKDILPFDHSRVILHRKNNEDGADYINANYIMSPDGKKGYIASQGPLPSTVHDFWLMIWQHKIKLIVMACKEIELGKHRCQRYWAQDGEELNFDGIAVKLLKEEFIAENLIERTLHAAQGDDSLEVKQLHYIAWPDHGVPKATKDLLNIIKCMRERHPWDDPPVLLHCSAGCGRTGVMVAADYGRRIIRKSPKTIDIYDIVMLLRKQRPSMVQSKEQYEYLHAVFKDLIEDHLTRQNEETVHPYVNIDLKKSESENAPLYENIFSMKSPPLANQRKGFTTQENKVESKKPLITNAINYPQKAMISTESPSVRPKPTPKPVKVLNLMDSDPDPVECHFQAPLIPIEPIDRKKQGSEKDHVSQSYIQLEPGNKKPVDEKDSASQNYINVDLGQPQLPAKPEKPERPEKPLMPQKNLDAGNRNKPDVMAKTVSLPKNNEGASGKNNHPKPSTKPVRNGGADSVDGARPPLPLKLKDQSEFDALLSPRLKDDPSNISRKLVVGKCQTIGRETPESRDERLDLWKKYGPDYDAPSCADSIEIPKPDYGVPSAGILNSTTKPNTGRSLPHMIGNNLVQESSRFGSSSQIMGPSNEELFPPFEPTSSIRVSPIIPKTDQLVTNKLVTSEICPNTANDGDPHSVPAKDNLICVESQKTNKKTAEFQRRDGLVRRTKQSIIRAETKSDGLVGTTNYLVSIHKAGVKPETYSPPVPLGKKALSSGELTVLKQAARPRRFLSEDAKSDSNGITGTDEVDAGNLYGPVKKGNPANQANQSNQANQANHSLYEVIWTDSERKPNISQNSQLNSDKPPALPPRTADSYLIKEENEFLEEQKQGDMQDTAARFDDTSAKNSNEQTSSQWWSAGVDKLKKLTNIKGALSVALRPNQRPGSQSDVPGSAFYSETPTVKDSNSNFSQDERTSPSRITLEKTFPHRIHQRPKGPRPAPSNWAASLK